MAMNAFPENSRRVMVEASDVEGDEQQHDPIDFYIVEPIPSQGNEHSTDEPKSRGQERPDSTSGESKAEARLSSTETHAAELSSVRGISCVLLRNFPLSACRDFVQGLMDLAADGLEQECYMTFDGQTYKPVWKYKVHGAHSIMAQEILNMSEAILHANLGSGMISSGDQGLLFRREVIADPQQPLVLQISPAIGDPDPLMLPPHAQVLLGLTKLFSKQVRATGIPWPSSHMMRLKSKTAVSGQTEVVPNTR